jgi:hypothetical protein
MVIGVIAPPAMALMATTTTPFPQGETTIETTASAQNHII